MSAITKYNLDGHSTIHPSQKLQTGIQTLTERSERCRIVLEEIQEISTSIAKNVDLQGEVIDGLQDKEREIEENVSESKEIVNIMRNGLFGGISNAFNTITKKVKGLFISTMEQPQYDVQKSPKLVSHSHHNRPSSSPQDDGIALNPEVNSALREFDKNLLILSAGLEELLKQQKQVGCALDHQNRQLEIIGEQTVSNSIFIRKVTEQTNKLT